MNPDNGQVSLSGVVIGSMAVYSCVEGYRVMGDDVRLCEQTEDVGGWTGQPPTCGTWNENLTMVVIAV